MGLGFFNPVGAAGEELGFGAGSGTLGDIFSFANDPLDLMGYRAENTRDQVSEIQRRAAQQGISAQQEMIDRINALYAPYRAAAQAGMGGYTNMVTGGEAGITPSPQYQMEVGRGTKSINRAMASRGAFNTSGRGAALADMLTSAGQNEASRQYGRQLDLQRLGTEAIGQIGQAGQTAGGNVGSIYGSLGQNLNSMYQNYGAQRQQSMNQGANALYGLSQYMMQK